MKNLIFKLGLLLAGGLLFIWGIASTLGQSSLTAPVLTLDRSYLSWSYPYANNIEFEIERRDTSGLAWLQLSSIQQTSANNTYLYYNDTTGLCGTTYVYRVRVHRLSDNLYSAYSNTSPSSYQPCASALTTAICSFSPLAIDLSKPISSLILSGDASRVFVNRFGYTSNLQVDIYETSSANLLSTITGINVNDVSADGSRFPYIETNAQEQAVLKLWTNGSIQTIAQMPSMRSPSISSDGSRVAFFGYDNATRTTNLYLWQDGLGYSAVVNDVRYPEKLKLSGDGTAIVYLAHGSSTNSYSVAPFIFRWDAVNGLSNIGLIPIDYRYDPHYFETYTLSVNADASAFGLSFNYDTHEYEIAAYNYSWRADEGLVLLSESISPDYYGLMSYNEQSLGWSADGERLFFLSIGDLTDENPDHSREYFFRDGTGIHQITTSLAPNTVINLATISADGRHILAYSQYPSPTSPSNLSTNPLQVVLGTCPAPVAMENFAAVTDLTAVSAGTNQINLSWSDVNSDETSYTLEVLSASSWLQVAELPANSTSYSHTLVTCGRQYQYRIRAYRASEGRYSQYSNLASAITSACATPLAPTNLYLQNLQEGSLRVTWRDNAWDETKYIIERVVGHPITTNSSSATPLADSAISPSAMGRVGAGIDLLSGSDSAGTWYVVGEVLADSTSFVDTVRCGTLYSYRVRAYRESDTSYSTYSTASSLTSSACGDFAPKNLAPSAITSGSINLSWQDIANNESSYLLERSAPSGWLEIAQLPANSTSFNDTGLPCSKDYQYRIRAYRIVDNRYSNYSGSGIITTLDCSEIGMPTDLQVTSSTSTSINLAWTDNADDETGFVIERQYQNSNTLVWGWTTIATIPANTTTYSDSAGLSCNYYYLYRIRALRPDNRSQLSNQAMGYLQCPPPLTPTNLRVLERSSNSIELVWDGNNTLSEFRLERSSDAGANWTEIAPIISDSGYENWTNTVDCGTTYQYRVRRYRSLDNSYSDYSNTLSVSSLSCPSFTPPSALQTLSNTGNSLSLGWQDNTSDETSFILEMSQNDVLWTVLSALPADTSSYTATGLSCATEYLFRIRAYRESDNAYSAYSLVYKGVAGACPSLNAPTSLQVTAIGSNSASLSWTDTNSLETAYRIERSADGLTWFEVGQLLANVTTFTDSSLNCASQYQYRLRAYRSQDAAYSDYSNTVSATTSACSSNSPSNLSISAMTDTSVSLTWTDNASDESNYRIERSSNGSTWTEIAQVTANSTSYLNSGIICNPAYQYRVRAYRAADTSYSSYSNTVTAVCPTPNAPSGLIATPNSASSIFISWIDNSINETSFQIEREYITGVWVQLSGLNLNANTSYVSINNLACGTSYNFRIRAYRSTDARYSDYSDVVNSSTLPCALKAASGLTVTSSSETAINLIWVDNALDESNYRLERSTNGTNWAEIANLAVETSAYEDTGLTCGLYYYRVRAYRASDNSYSTYSNVVFGTISACSLLSAPSNLAGTLSGNIVNFTWSDSNTSESAFRLEMSSDAGATWQEIAAPLNNSSTYSYTLNTCGATYTFRIRAYRSLDNSFSDYSNSVDIQAWLCSPSNLSLNQSSAGNVTLSWVDNSLNETAYRVERSSNAGSTWTEIAQLAADTVSYNNTGFLCYQTRYRVRAYRAGDNQYSAYSNVAYLTCPPPAAPTNLVLISRTSDSISISWTDNATDEDYYNVDRSSNGGLTWTMWTLWPNNTSYTHSGLSCNTTYQYRVRVYRASDMTYSSDSNTLIVTTLACPPTAPSNLTITDNSAGNVSLNWLDNASDESGYRLERSTNTGSTWTEIAQLGANTTSYSDTGVLCSQYRYRVRAAGVTDVYSAYSNVAYLPCPPPAAPTNLVQTSSTVNSIGIAWTDNASDETDFKLEHSTDGGITWSAPSTHGANNTATTLVNVQCSSRHDFRIRAYRSSDNVYSDYSNVLASRTLPCAPSNLSITDDLGGNVTLNWIDNASDESQYRLERSTNSGSSWTEIAQLDAGTTTYSDTGVLCSQYRYRLRVYREIDNRYSAYSGVAYLTCQPLATPTNLVMSSNTSNSISMVWADNASGETAYYVERSSNGGSSWSSWSLAADATTYTHSALSCNSSYQYRVRAYRSGDAVYSSYSNILTASTLACPPNAPSSLTITDNSGGNVTLNWLDNASNESSYRLERSTNAGTSWTEIAQLEANSTSYNDTGVLCSQYRYRVRAAGATDVYSAYSNVAYLPCPAPAAPTNLVFTGSTNNSITLAWLDNASDETLYYLERSSNGGSSWSSWSLVANANTYTQSGLSCNSSYLYRVRAYRSGDAVYSSYSNILTASTLACPPNAPSSLTITDNSGGNVTLNWLDNASNESGYRLERSTNTGTSWTETAQLSANSTSYNDTGVLCSQYRYRVRAAGATDVYSAYSNVVYLPCPPPAAPSNFRLTAIFPHAAYFAWVDNANDETNYNLQQSTDGGLTWISTYTIGANLTSHADYVNCNSSYQYRVRAYRSTDMVYSTPSNTISFTSSACLYAPSNLISTAQTSTSINLAWTDNSSDESVFRIERSTNGVNFTQIAQVPANTSSYNDTGRLCNTQYWYRVRMYRNSDSLNSAYSNILDLNTAICVTLNAPTNFVLNNSNNSSLSFSWHDNSTNESGYELERSLDGTTWQILASLPANSTSYADSGLGCLTNYRYRLRALHLGNGTYSAYGTSPFYTTLSCPPLVASILSSTGSSLNSIALSWTVDATATSFTLYYNQGAQWLSLGTFNKLTNSFTHNGLSCGQAYQYRILSYRQNDNSSLYSADFSTSSQVCSALAAPLAPTVVNAELALVSLQIPALPAGANSMRLERSTDGLNWLSLGAVTSYYLDTTVTCGTNYQYRLVAYRASDGQSSTPSTLAYATTLTCPVALNHLVGVYRSGQWIFVESNASANPVSNFNFGDGQWQALVGDWNGDGLDGLGLYRNGEFILRDTSAGSISELRFNFGENQAGWQAVAGDWNGDGIDSIGLYKDGVFILSDDNQNQNYRFNLGDAQADWLVVAGDWDGNGTDGIGLYKDGLWLLVDSVLNPVPQSINYGPNQAGWLPIAGDWDGDGMDTIGLYKDGLWRLRLNSNTAGIETSLSFGQAGDRPMAIVENEAEALVAFAALISAPPVPELPSLEPELPTPAPEPTEPSAEITPEVTDTP